MFLRPLDRITMSIPYPDQNSKNVGHLDELWLGVPIIELHLVDRRPILERIRRQILDPDISETSSNRDGERATATKHTHLRTLKLRYTVRHTQCERTNDDAYLLMPMFLIFPLSTNSSSFFHVG